ncbi:MAG: transporter [Bacteroidota bacterium]
MKSLLTTVFLFAITAHSSFAQWDGHRPDGHSSINIMGDHTHEKGEIMFSYRLMHMLMDGNRDGTDELALSEILGGTQGTGSYMVAPTEMPMIMHMFGAMYAVSDNVTLMTMIPFLDNSMDHLTAMGQEFTTESGGIGDISVSALYTFFRKRNMKMHWQIGLSLPTGSIEEMDVTPASDPNETILPYPMQIGSGSFDFIPGLTFLHQTSSISYGVQLRSAIRLTDNDNDYRLGDRFETNVWGGYRLTDWLSPQVSARFSTWENISGADDRLNPAMIHTADPLLKGGSRVDLGVGLNLMAPENTSLKGARLGISYEVPVYQYLQGPQMQLTGIATVGVMYSFH